MARSQCIKKSSMFDGIGDELDCILAVSGSDAEFYCMDNAVREEALLEESSYDEKEDSSDYDPEYDSALGLVDEAAEDYRKTRDSGWEAFIDRDIEDIMIDDEDLEDDDCEFDDAWPDDYDRVLPDEEQFDYTL